MWFWLSRIFLSFTLVYGLFLDVHANEACSQYLSGNSASKNELIKKVLRAFRDNYNLSAYQRGYCAVNVTRLATAIMKDVPQLKPDDFKVHITSRLPLIPAAHKGEDFFRTQRSRDNSRSGDHFFYHVFLEYKGFIFDLDNGPNAAAFPIDIYLQRFFTADDSKLLHKQATLGDLLVWSINGEEYFSELPSHRWSEKTFWDRFKQFTLDYEPQPLISLANY